MIEFPRSLARQLWAVWRRAVPKPYSAHSPLAEFVAGPKGLHIRVAHPEIAVEYRQPGTFPAETVQVPLTALGDFEGKGKDTVTLEAGDNGQVVAQWQDANVPRVVEYEIDDKVRQPQFPDVPERFVRNPPELLKALEEAGHSVSDSAIRYALNRLLLRGKSGEVIATDGKQLLIQGGFHFPWDGDLLVPRLNAVGCRELGSNVPVEIGNTEHYVVMRIGPWTFHLSIEANARYPKVEEVIPKLGSHATHWRIDPEDAAFLSRTLPHLPGQDEDHQPLTVDLNGQVCVRAGSGQGRATEVLLARSSHTGPAVRFCADRQFMVRLLKLGFEEVHVVDADTPVLCQDNRRIFVTMPLDKKGAIPPAEGMLRIASAEVEQPKGSPTPERKKRTMPQPSSNGNGTSAPHRRVASSEPKNGNTAFGSVIGEVQALKDVLRDAYGRVNGLVVALKRQRKQSKLVQSTLASLKQLQQIEG